MLSAAGHRGRERVVAELLEWQQPRQQHLVQLADQQRQDVIASMPAGETADAVSAAPRHARRRWAGAGGCDARTIASAATAATEMAACHR